MERCRPGRRRARAGQLIIILLLTASVTGAVAALSANSPKALPICTPAIVARALGISTPPTHVTGHGGAQVTQELQATVLKPGTCKPPPPPPPPQPPVSPPAPAPHVGIALRIGQTSKTACEVVTRWIPAPRTHRYHWVVSHYCRTHTGRGTWQNVSGTPSLPRWDILTGAQTRLIATVTVTDLGTGQRLPNVPLSVSGAAPGQTGMVLQTDAAGHAKFPLTFGPSRVLSVSSTTGSTKATAQAIITYPAYSTIRPDTRRVRISEPLVVRGLLLGGALPAQGNAADIIIEYQHQQSGAWHRWHHATFVGAQWSALLTTPISWQPQTIALRALILPRNGYPFLPSTTGVVHVFLLAP